MNSSLPFSHSHFPSLRIYIGHVLRNTRQRLVSVSHELGGLSRDGSGSLERIHARPEPRHPFVFHGPLSTFPSSFFRPRHASHASEPRLGAVGTAGFSQLLRSLLLFSHRRLARAARAPAPVRSLRTVPNQTKSNLGGFVQLHLRNGPTSIPCDERRRGTCADEETPHRWDWTQEIRAFLDGSRRKPASLPRRIFDTCRRGGRQEERGNPPRATSFRVVEGSGSDGRRTHRFDLSDDVFRRCEERTWCERRAFLHATMLLHPHEEILHLFVEPDPRTKNRATERGRGGGGRRVRRSVLDGVDIRRRWHASVRFHATRLPCLCVPAVHRRPSTPSLSRVSSAIARGAPSCPFVPFETDQRSDRRPVRTRMDFP